MGMEKKMSEWINIKSNRPVTSIFGPTGAYKYRELNNGGIEVMCRNSLTKKETSIELLESFREGFEEWIMGLGPIQMCLPNASASVREMLLSGMTDDEFSKEEE